MSRPTTQDRVLAWKPPGWIHALTSRSRRSLLVIIGPVAVLLLWQWVSSVGAVDALILPSPASVLAGIIELMRSGTLEQDIAVSMSRILAGWAIGSAIAIPIGLLVGSFGVARRLIDPFIHFFRFVPSIALITLFILWFGVGEQSKVMLIVYSTAFLVVVNTATGVVAIPTDKRDAARCLGASSWEVFFHVTTPATVPYIFVGMRLALAAAFLVIVGAEIIASNSGLGYLIWTSRLYFRVDWVFGGVIVIGALGLLSDRLWGLFGRRVLGKYLGLVTQY